MSDDYICYPEWVVKYYFYNSHFEREFRKMRVFAPDEKEACEKAIRMLYKVNLDASIEDVWEHRDNFYDE